MTTTNKITYKWGGGSWIKGARKEIFKRLVTAGEHLKTEIQKTISVASDTGPSRAGEPPHADMGSLRKSIFRTTDEKTLTTIVGTNSKVGFWMEFGTRRRVPKTKKALAIPLTRQEATEIANRSKYFIRGRRGGVLKRGNSLRARMARAGIKRNKRGRSRRPFVLLRSSAKPILPRPFFRRTVNEQKRNLARIMNQPIKVPIVLVPINPDSAGGGVA